MRKKIIVIIIWFYIFTNFSCISGDTNQKSLEYKSDSVGINYYKKARKLKKIYRYDSAYFFLHKSISLFNKSTDSMRIAKAYFQLATIDYYHHDLMSCEKNCTTSLENIPDREHNYYTTYVFNLLGLVSKSKKQPKEAIQLFEKSQQIYRKKTDTLKDFIAYQNNVGRVYEIIGNYQKAILFYDKILNVDSVKIRYPKRYARALNNKAWCLFQNNEKNIAFPLLNQSLKIREKENDKSGLIMSYIQLAEFFLNKNKTTSKNYALNALIICDEINSPNDKLKTLYLLAKTDSLRANEYFSQHKHLQDSLIEKERLFKDQTAKIRYETTQKEAKIKAQKNELSTKNRGLLIGSFLFVLVGVSAVSFYRQKNKITRQKNAIETQKNHVEVLQRELHHRMKNNLSFVDLFINLAKSKFPDDAYQTKLNELQNRMTSMFEVHKQLFKKKDITSLNAKNYIDILVLNVKNANMKENITTSNSTDSNQLLSADISLPVGLIINEFVTNSYKHAFEIGKKGKIDISLNSDSNSYYLELKDNGKGLPKDFNITNLDSFGFESMQLLVQEYKGIFSFNGKGGVNLNITIPKTKI